MKEYDVAVIGAGVGGLAAALKLSASGMKVVLLEKQPVPGGFATSFTRKGFTFESSIHCVDSLSENGEIREFLEEYGVGSSSDFIELRDFGRVIYPGHDFISDFSKEHFIEFLKESFTHEKDNIDALFREFDEFYVQFDRFTSSRLPNWINLSLAPVIYPKIIKASCLSAAQLINKFIKDPKLLAIICDIWRFIGTPPSRLSAFYFLIVFRGYHYNKTSYAKGGFMRLFKKITDRIEGNGSRVMFNVSVKKILVRRGSVYGVLTDKGEELRSRAVVSNATAMSTFGDLLDNSSGGKLFRKVSAMEQSVSAFQVYLGLDIPADHLGMQQARISVNTCYDHEANLNASLSGDYDNCLLEITDHSQTDSSLVPPGKGSLVIMTFDSCSRWQCLNNEEYKKRKAEVADKLIARAEKYLPGLRGHIEVIEAATPLTMQHYAGSESGAIYGFAQTVAQGSINRLPQDCPVKGLFLSGAWTQPGAGVHGCFVSGADAADKVLKYLKRNPVSCCLC